MSHRPDRKGAAPTGWADSSSPAAAAVGRRAACNSAAQQSWDSAVAASDRSSSAVGPPEARQGCPTACPSAVHLRDTLSSSDSHPSVCPTGKPLVWSPWPTVGAFPLKSARTLSQSAGSDRSDYAGFGEESSYAIESLPEADDANWGNQANYPEWLTRLRELAATNSVAGAYVILPRHRVLALRRESAPRITPRCRGPQADACRLSRLIRYQGRQHLSARYDGLAAVVADSTKPRSSRGKAGSFGAHFVVHRCGWGSLARSMRLAFDLTRSSCYE